MNNYKLTVSFLLIASFFCSCTKDTETSTITFKVSSRNESWDDKFVFDKSVALNGKDSVILSVVTKCLIGDDQVIIHDAKNRKIFAYTKEGEFKRQIGREGRARSEYINIRDIAFSEDRSLVYVLDDNGIVVYNASTGNFQRREKIELPDFANYWKLAVLGTGHYLLFNPRQNGLGEIIEYTDGDWRDIKKAGFYQLSCERFYTFGNTVRVIPSYGEFNVCTFDEGQLTPYFNIEFDDHVLPAELRPKSFREFREISDDDRWFRCILDACETSSWVYANVIAPKETCHWVFGNKESGNVISGSMPMEDGMHIVGSDDKSFYAIVYPELVGKDSYIRRVIKDMDEASNDLFFITFHIKE